VIDLIQLKTILGFYKSPYFLTNQFNPLFGISTISKLTVGCIENMKYVVPS